MKERSMKYGGKYVSVHLRFEEVRFNWKEVLLCNFLLYDVQQGDYHLPILVASKVIFSFVQDMVAFSCCIFDGGEQEKEDMVAAREKGWKGKFTKPGRVIRPGAIRINGKCPLTPLEVLFIVCIPY